MKKIMLFMLVLPVISFAHPGRTNSSSCHNNRKNGGYHCHNSKPSSSNHRYSTRLTNSVNKSVYFNTDSYKYHSHSCLWAKACTVNCISIPRDEAVRRGGFPCKVCGGF